MMKGEINFDNLRKIVVINSESFQKYFILYFVILLS